MMVTGQVMSNYINFADSMSDKLISGLESKKLIKKTYIIKKYLPSNFKIWILTIYCINV